MLSLHYVNLVKVTEVQYNPRIALLVNLDLSLYIIK